MPVALLLSLLVCGCGSENQIRSDLKAGYQALENQNYDDALARADTFLQKTPAGQGSAEALYLRGRALEQKSARSPHEAHTNLQAARNAYLDALKCSPAPKLQTYLHTSLGNVAYFQDDFKTADAQWTIAYDKLQDENDKAWVLYRIGLCKQRLGQFADADTIYLAVQDRFPNTIPAQRAKEKQGVRGFSLQLATFASSASADNAIGTLRRQGVTAMRQDANGRSIVLVGPLPTYQQAQVLKGRYAGVYPDSIIVP
jgi:tetratricopeptide (TPR) repeat protein